MTGMRPEERSHRLVTRRTQGKSDTRKRPFSDPRPPLGVFADIDALVHHAETATA